ncbi:unnamed protein product [Meloidogyne enterolobii]|uniref:Uncharacterized protein n=1 Tax=Meloidogyne enterolobii TaxID=390850 RepID=A0ACB0ZFC5_MELEN
MVTLEKHSKNYQQLVSCVNYFVGQEKSLALFDMVNKIAKSDDKLIFKEKNLDYVLKYFEKVDKKQSKKPAFIIGKTKKEEKNDKKMQQYINLENLVRLGYLRFIYMGEFCENVDIIYEEEILVSFKDYLKNFCDKYVKHILTSLKSLLQLG